MKQTLKNGCGSPLEIAILLTTPAASILALPDGRKSSNAIHCVCIMNASSVHPDTPQYCVTARDQKTDEEVRALRHHLHTVLELPIKEQYDAFIQSLLKQE